MYVGREVVGYVRDVGNCIEVKARIMSVFPEKECECFEKSVVSKE